MEQFRNDVVSRLRAELFGPARGEEEELKGRPVWRYLCGMLFPSDFEATKSGDQVEGDEEAVADRNEMEDPVFGRAYDDLPSSMGVSFFARGAKSLVCRVQAAEYAREDEGKDSWVRRALASATNPETVPFDFPKSGKRRAQDKVALGGKARVNVVFRPRMDGHLVTVSLVNEKRALSTKSADQVAAMLFQCCFEVELDGGEIGTYPRVSRFALHPEDEELEFAYRSRRPFGIGHGCAAVWPTEFDGHGPRSIRAEPLPSYEVRGLTNEISLPGGAERALSIQWLASRDRSHLELREALSAFLDTYSDWVDAQAAESSKFQEEDLATAGRLVERQNRALARMREGCSFLTREPSSDELDAFRIAQEAMLRQFLLTDRRGSPKDLGDGLVDPIDPWSTDHAQIPRWRPFQLAYQLLVLESIARPESGDREVLDLLWFPTGGGKTEAYLAMSAFEIVLRRLHYGEAGAGTAVLMRYTLRLLTSQQFERCATLISVLELIRREQPELDLGEVPIRLGLWVGGATTPNRLDSDSESDPGARQLFEMRVLEDDPPSNPFQLRACPYCGTRIVPRHKSPREEDYGIHVTASEFRMFCPDGNCPLHDEIPVSVVDDDLFKRPPSFLIGTIDKFARMVWDARSRVFLGRGVASGTLAPSLIIQDELHLITGPLGTIAGLYEAAIDSVLKLSGVVPKYLAATATIQRAGEQCRLLYARDAFVFPPSGLEADDSFYSREDRDSPGRTFVGVMGNGMYSSLTSLVQVSSSAAQAVVEIPETQEKARDGFWTQVIYHNSRQELGKTTTMLRDDVRSRLEILEPDEQMRRDFDSIEELSASLKGSEVSEALERLQIEWPSDDVIDAVACTNMISVGIDVARLGLMIVKGQPKSTAEYIQATSRVGRDSNRPPGIVVTLYAANRPRDRSHYETFQTYHQTLYRAVEPATVTPFSPPARDRTMHAALVLAVRHVLGWEEPSDAARFEAESSEIRGILAGLSDRLTRSCRPDELQEVLEHLQERASEWTRGVLENKQPPLTFDSGKQFPCLLTHFPTDGRSPSGVWPTLNSMRHVDGEVRFDVRGQRTGDDS